MPSRRISVAIGGTLKMREMKMRDMKIRDVKMRDKKIRDMNIRENEYAGETCAKSNVYTTGQFSTVR